MTMMMMMMMMTRDPAAAGRLFERMKAGENKPCVFAYTTLIKGKTLPLPCVPTAFVHVAKNSAFPCGFPGLCGASDIHRAGKKLAEMERQQVGRKTLPFLALPLPFCQRLTPLVVVLQPPVTPNIRTVNTFLRGCLLAGAVRPATRTFRRLPDWSVVRHCPFTAFHCPFTVFHHLSPRFC